jgi:glycosyltransferase involved in cell wall biosynthesis
MRIAQVAPLYESVPPRLYGGTERVVHYITEELVAMGHDVTLFGSGDSVTSARLISPCPVALRLSSTRFDSLALHLTLLEQVYRAAGRFDIIHFHLDYLHFPVSRRQQIPHVTTLHGRLDTPGLSLLYREFSEIPLVSISDAQRQPIPRANWQATVHHGLPLDVLSAGDGSGGYLAFIGRISPEKGVERAIEIAQRVDMPLKIAAKIDEADREYYELHIRHLFDSENVEYIGEISESDKGEFLGNATALLFPIDWPEPFGLVMIEALACGCPVIAFDRGSVPEVIDHGVTGFVVDSVEKAAEAVRKIAAIDRDTCRAIFESRFSATRMAEDYIDVYARLQQSTTFSEALESVPK